jgi:hypothetical protein
MNRLQLEKAARLSEKMGRTFMATAGRDYLPHVTSSEAMVVVGDRIVELMYWFCPLTMENLRDNSRCSIVVWDENSDAGYQVIGRVVKAEEMAVLDGYSADIFEKKTIPQVKRKLSVEVEKVLPFTRSPHDDRELEF